MTTPQIIDQLEDIKEKLWSVKPPRFLVNTAQGPFCVEIGNKYDRQIFVYPCYENLELDDCRCLYFGELTPSMKTYEGRDIRISVYIRADKVNVYWTGQGLSDQAMINFHEAIGKPLETFINENIFPKLEDLFFDASDARYYREAGSMLDDALEFLELINRDRLTN